MTYQEFLEQKIKVASLNGLDCKQDEISPILKPHQRDIVQWAVRGGQRAIFAQFGLGKSLMQLEIMRLIQSKTGGKTLIVCPLGVRQEFMRDSAMVGTQLKFIRRPEEIEHRPGSEGARSSCCPLQFDIVDRLINRYSNKRELVYGPFAELMTVPYRAILLGRRGGGSELSEDYFRDGLRYLDMAEHNVLAPTLFGDEGLAGGVSERQVDGLHR